ncbi:MAG: hypothetical protein UX39_C0025G0008 [Candidatus Magasanikbacteria bacterium GW2011_GWA2_46_17]|uniref:DUF11 domain-containing protein n=1 Tax=Candidatus Magasanikbacteria bacterium GW2011_GWA2_46_17 TaxID=1619042 RepID=A0A0G1R647_9BACT|nr:MAG: hypothetical protein UX39_C0025G0008 [Candidatus Magasanikbacteria bacterium GW2011_GWA2_46_17]
MSSDNFPDFKNSEESEDNLEVLKESLYSRHDYFSGREKRQGGFNKHDVEVSSNWGDEDINSKMRPFQDPNKRVLFLKKLFLTAVIFFVVSVAVSVYVFFGGGNIISSSNVDISIIGPVAIAGGEALPLEISVTNGNNGDLETADLILDYPEGTREPADTNVTVKRYREALGTIAKGQAETKKIQAVLFGEEGDVKTIGISVEYRLKGSNAIFSKKKEYNVTISSTPVTLTVSAVKDINANQDTEFSVDIVSNGSSIIQNLALAAEYPFGFTFVSSNPAPSWSNSFWQLGDIKPGVKRNIKIIGKIAGQDNEERTLRFSVGTESAANENSIGTNFLTATKKISIRKPFIGTSFALNGDTSDAYVIVKPGKVIRADLTVSNNVGVKITDVRVSAIPAGNIFDPGSVSVGDGFFRSSDKAILWDQTLKPSLSALNPDDTETLSFSLSTLPDSEIRAINNPEMNIIVTVSGKRLDDAGVSREVTSTVTKTVRVASTIGLSARALHFSGPFGNSGPIPPKIDAETSYTIVWSLTNLQNNLSNVKVTATLPSYMKWLNRSGPGAEKISYNPIGGQILWDAGDLRAGTGLSDSPREVSFQVSLIPSLSQVNNIPTLVSEAVAIGEDDFAGLTVQSSTRVPLTTNLTTDVGFVQGQGIVTK